MSDEATRRQKEYYERTAEHYAEMHVSPGDEHFIALEYIIAMLSVIRAESVLDVGSGTGRAVQYLRERRPDLRVVGLEPSDSLRARASLMGGDFVGGDATHLPFAAGEFDAVVALGVMHHVADPNAVVEEFCRVARTAVMISDSNRFGQGRKASRLAKVAIHRLGLWRSFDLLRTRGRGYMESAGDGIFYSYSIYDSLSALARWGTRTFVVPTQGKPSGALGPFTGSTHGLLVCLREPTEDWAGA
jgi:SAM-dependent methyltransferase